PRRPDPVSAFVHRECATNALRIDAEQLARFQHLVGILPTRDHPAELRHQVEQEREAHPDARMNQKPRDAAGGLSYREKRHHTIEGHEAAMHADQDGGSGRGHVFESGCLDAPVAPMKEAEKTLRTAPDERGVEAVWIEAFDRCPG